MLGWFGRLMGQHKAQTSQVPYNGIEVNEDLKQERTVVKRSPRHIGAHARDYCPSCGRFVPVTRKGFWKHHCVAETQL